MNSAFIVLLLGIGGVGKSTIAATLVRILAERGINVRLVRFDELRKKLAPPKMDPFSGDPVVKRAIYEAAVPEFQRVLLDGTSLVVDCGLSQEHIRQQLKKKLPELKICHIYCPLFVAIFRDSMRSLLNKKHERGKWLHLRALRDRLNPFSKEKFPQPGVTTPFDYPECADLHVSTFCRKPSVAAEEIAQKLELWRSATLQ